MMDKPLYAVVPGVAVATRILRLVKFRCKKNILPYLTSIELRGPTDMADLQEKNANHTKDETGHEDIPAGHIVDYISGKLVKATPEEVEAVQVFAQRLVEDFGYPKEVITTRPQFRVRPRPSAERTRGYPVDIAVFDELRTCTTNAKPAEKQLNSGFWFARNIGPSAERTRGYPVDIAVFDDTAKLEDNAFILVECKRKRPARMAKNNYNSTSPCLLPKLVFGSMETTISIFIRNIFRTRWEP